MAERRVNGAGHWSVPRLIRSPDDILRTHFGGTFLGAGAYLPALPCAIFSQHHARAPCLEPAMCAWCWGASERAGELAPCVGQSETDCCEYRPATELVEERTNAAELRKVRQERRRSAPRKGDLR